MKKVFTFLVLFLAIGCDQGKPAPVPNTSVVFKYSDSQKNTWLKNQQIQFVNLTNSKEVSKISYADDGIFDLSTILKDGDNTIVAKYTSNITDTVKIKNTVIFEQDAYRYTKAAEVYLNDVKLNQSSVGNFVQTYLLN